MARKEKRNLPAGIYPEAVRFTGFNIFYKNDTEKVGKEGEMEPEEVLKLVSMPIYIQYRGEKFPEKKFYP